MSTKSSFCILLRFRAKAERISSVLIPVVRVSYPWAAMADGAVQVAILVLGRQVVSVSVIVIIAGGHTVRIGYDPV